MDLCGFYALVGTLPSLSHTHHCVDDEHVFMIVYSMIVYDCLCHFMSMFVPMLLFALMLMMVVLL